MTIMNLHNAELKLISLINGQVSRLSIGAHGALIRAYWNHLIYNRKNPIFTLLRNLLVNGMNLRTLESVINLLIKLKVDVTNPWSTESLLRKIIGSSTLSVGLLGVDTSLFKENVFFNSSEVAYKGLAYTEQEFVPNQDAVLYFRSTIERLRLKNQSVILSSEPYFIIAEMIEASQNDIFESILRELIPQLWLQLDIPRDSEAIVYFRSFKTFASDIDLFYLGPKEELIILHLAKYFHLLGFRFDLRVCYAISNEVRQNRLSVHDFFFPGVTLEFGATTTAIKRTLTTLIDKTKLLSEEIYPHLCKQIVCWIGKEIDNPLTLDKRQFKLLMFRAIVNLVYCLCVKFNKRFTYQNINIINMLSCYLEDHELLTLQNGIRLINQIRNIYQLQSFRKGEDVINDLEFEKIKRVLSRQGIKDLNHSLRMLGQQVDEIREKYLGEYIFKETKFDEISTKSLRTDFYVMQSVSKCLEGYKFLMLL